MNNLFDGSLPSLNIGNSLDTLVFSERAEALKSACKKIAYEGTIEIEGVDYFDTVRAANQGFLPLEEFNQLICDTKSISALNNISIELIQLGFSPILQRRNNYRFYIKARRNTPQ